MTTEAEPAGDTERDTQGGRIARALHAHGDKVLFLVVGGMNTVIGYGLFAIALFLANRAFPTARGWVVADAALVVSWTIGATISWATFKLFVFRTRGTDWGREWRRAYVVYAPSLAMNLGALSALVGLLGIRPLVGQALWAVFQAIYSYFAHKWFTFGAPKGTPEEEPTGF